MGEAGRGLKRKGPPGEGGPLATVANWWSSVPTEEMPMTVNQGGTVGAPATEREAVADNWASDSKITQHLHKHDKLANIILQQQTLKNLF